MFTTKPDWTWRGMEVPYMGTENVDFGVWHQVGWDDAIEDNWMEFTVVIWANSDETEYRYTFD